MVVRICPISSCVEFQFQCPSCSPHPSCSCCRNSDETVERCARTCAASYTALTAVLARARAEEAFGLFDESGDPRIEGEPGTRESAELGLCETWHNEFGTRHGVLGAIFETVPHKGPILAYQQRVEESAASHYSTQLPTLPARHRTRSCERRS